MSDGEDGRDRVGMEAADGEQQRVDRRLVEPLGVIEQAQQRPVAGELREQAQRRRSRNVPLDRCPAGPERGAQRLRLRAGECAETIKVAREEQLERGERHLGLGLDAHHSRDPSTTADASRRTARRWSADSSTRAVGSRRRSRDGYEQGNRGGSEAAASTSTDAGTDSRARRFPISNAASAADPRGVTAR
nr:hypothetical protein [Kibdelosporangium sp. MJ126-NF4]CTQ98936.1 hypothetical protein [Kibdelosporangium sp. MJ126-NF4]